jgi:hypothetical protein
VLRAATFRERVGDTIREMFAEDIAERDYAKQQSRQTQDFTI